ncbi:c2h2 type zinc finger domain protein [Diplodia corticola]|uniref:C2h2 type zinc finger domain protein n=1 Tax=Diplodia corticola TaxID=236234 RepID=A0A1J9S2Y8_9PEZI|nr:c2h2 type zinc finger domain protein [Diplodia corticola]OJD34919.1 c2h2 type zinc finger domain protein [Diplodia corticola]
MDNPSAESDKPRGLFQCTECKRSYTRVDHLARHVRSHLQEKPFQCHVCHKGFGRPDLLKRHAIGHDTDGNAKRQKRTLTQSSRVSQACKSCAYAKLKCEDEKPCKRCQNKGIVCESNSDHRQPPTSASASTQPPGESSLDTSASPTHLFVAPSPTNPIDQPQPVSIAPVPVMGEPDQVNNQIPTPSTLLNGFEISGDDASLSGTAFTPSIAPDPGALSSSLTVHENNFYDFLRNVLTPNNPGSLSPTHWDFEPRNILDFNVEDDLSFDANDFGLLDAFNGKPFNSHEDFGVFPPTIHPPSLSAPAVSTPSDSGHQTDRRRAGIGAEAYRRSSFVRWQPAHEGAFLEVGKISTPHEEAASPDTRYKPDQRILSERLEQSSRDKLLAIILNTCDATNLGRVVSSFPSADLLDDFLQCFFAREGPLIDSFIHIPTFNPNTIKPELLGAIVAAGAVSTDMKALQKLGHAIQEAVRIAIVDAIERRNAITRELWAIQSFLLIIDTFLWSGNRRKMEIAESQQQPLWTMLRRAGRFKKPRGPPIAPLPEDTGNTLHQKWLQWVEQESSRRLVFRGFCYDAQSSMSLLVNPIISYGELCLPFPAARDLWTAETAEQWKSAYFAHRADSPASSICLLDCLKDPKLVASFPGMIDHDFAALIVLHGIWGMVWEFNQLQLTLKSNSGEYNSSLVMKHRHQELCQTIHHLRISVNSWRITPSPEITLLLELQLLYLHLSIEDVQLFAGKEDQDDARRVLPALQQWMHDTYARTAVWQAARVLRAAKTFPRKHLRNFWAIAVYHASLALWTYGIIEQATTAVSSGISATCTCVSMPGGLSDEFYAHETDHSAHSQPTAGNGNSSMTGATTTDAGSAVWLEGPETPDVQRFVTLGRGQPVISNSSMRGIGATSSSGDQRLVPLSDPEATMNVVLETLRKNFGAATTKSSREEVMTEQQRQKQQETGATGLLPPLVENLVQLMRDLGKAAGAVGS